MNYGDKNEHLNDESLENTKKKNEASDGQKNVSSENNQVADQDASGEKSKSAENHPSQESRKIETKGNTPGEPSADPGDDVKDDETAKDETAGDDVTGITAGGDDLPPADNTEKEQPAAVIEKSSRGAIEENKDQDGLQKNQPESKEDQPESKEDQPESKEDQPESKEDQPDSKEDQPESKEDQPESKEDQPESKEDQPESKEDQPESKENQPGSKTENIESSEDTSVEAEASGHKREKTSEEKPGESSPDYELLSKSDLVKLLEELISNKPFNELRTDVYDIEAVYNKKLEEELKVKKERFLSEGGLEQDFKPVEDPADKQMSELLNRYRGLKADFNKQMEQEKETNLEAKKEILEEFRILMEGQEGFDNTFRKFKQLQRRWFDIGIIPKQNVKDLWNSYNFFVDKFNDYVKINRELRELDLSKNFDQKVELCVKAEELAREKNVSSAFRTLQKYHARWREIGPVPREKKDELWQRFKEATSIINKAHQEFQAEMKDSLVENLEKKKLLCEKAEALAGLDISKHGDWVVRTNELLAIQKEWKTIGYAPKKDNNKIYARFRQACDSFFDKKAKYYASTFEHQKENVEEKKKIIEAAEELKDSKEWKSATDKLIELQKKWKEIGPVPRKESEKLWKRFRSACDHFFNTKAEFFSGKNESYEENLKEKEALIREMQEFSIPEKTSQLLSALEEFQSRYNEIGFVPVEVKDKIREDFKSALNGIIEKTDSTEEDKTLMKYRIKTASLLSSPRSDNKIRFERDRMIKKLQQLKNDIGIWENNIGFFKETESAEDTISEFSEKIEEARQRINTYERKIRIIDELEDEI